MATIVSLYTDGGCITRNPSPIGGTWAFRGVYANGYCALSDSGVITPEECGMTTVSNNVSELAAAVFALEAMPEGWKETLFTDSEVTLLRVRQTKRQAKLNGVPESLRSLLAEQKARLGKYEVVLVAGHPSKLELFRGVSKSGLPVSLENVRVDAECRRQAERYMRERKVVTV